MLRRTACSNEEVPWLSLERGGTSSAQKWLFNRKVLTHVLSPEPTITGVGTAQQRDYTLAGACDAAGGQSQTVGWAVGFDPPDPPKPGEPPNEPSMCAWSGQLQTVVAGGQAIEFIVTSSYLALTTDRPDDWESMLSGKD